MKTYQKGMVSIIIPTFQSETYLEKCLTSVVGQSYPSIEVIICDGKSSDGTWEIAGRFAKKYPFVKRMKQSKKGVSNARNEGMAAAGGEYIQFVDSDDFLLPETTEKLVHALEEKNAELVLAGFKMLKTGEERRPSEGFYENVTAFVENRFTEAYGYRTNFINTPWNKLYRRSCIQTGFPEDLSLGEDLIFNLEALTCAKGIAVIPDVVYEYNNLNENSLMHCYRRDGIAIEGRLYRAVRDFAKGCPGRNMWKEDAAIRKVVRGNYRHGVRGNLYVRKKRLLNRLGLRLA